jgi:hypothetical protein
MSSRKLILALYKVLAEPVLKWSDDTVDDDLIDAIDHVNLMKNRRMEKGIYDVEFIENKTMDPRKLRQSSAFMGKPYGWLKGTPKETWVKEFDKIYDRDISYILDSGDNHEFNLPIAIDDELCDGYARVLLAHALGENVPVAYFKGIVDEG